MTVAATSGPRLTRQQADALNLSGVSVALSAGAGCGKTTVLTERFLRAVSGSDPIPLDRVVALTFTNKAARELRDRIRRESRARLDTRPPAAEADRWRSILRGLEAARIGTFHAFCGDILRRHATAAGIDPASVVFDEPVSMAIRIDAVSRSLREGLSARDPDLLDLAVEFDLRTVVSTLESLLGNRSVGDLPHWANRDPDDVVREWVATWTDRVRPQLLADFATRARPCLERLSAPDITNPKVIERRTGLSEAFARLEARGSDPGSALEAIHDLARMTGLMGKGCWPSAEAQAEAKTGFEEIRDQVKKLGKAFQWDEATTRIAARQGGQFARLVLQARDHYDASKRRRGGIDHDDLLLLTRTLLATHGDTVRAEVAGSMDLLLVDEFQDTDPIQAEILEQLAGPGLADGRMFLVGDFKQSIYRFRGAQPDLFHNYRDRFPPAGRRSLTENFRSVPAVLDFVNALFASTFREESDALEPGGGRPEPDSSEPAVLFLWDDTSSAEPPSPSPRAGRDSGRDDSVVRRRSEGRRIARYLRDRLDAGWPVRGPGGIIRKATAGDVALLFRSLADASFYEEALAEFGLDYHVIGGLGFFAQQEVSDIINTLTAIEDPLDAVALAGALRSPMFSVSDEGLFRLAGEDPGRLHAGLDRAEGAWLDRFTPSDRNQVVRARELLNRWRAAKDRSTIAGLVEMVLDESGYELSLQGETLGDRKRANARKLVRMARGFDEQGGFGLADFVVQLRADLRGATKENQAATTDETGPIIRLMSIHQAKGLEFPIVVIPDLDRKRPGDRQRVAFDGVLGPLVNPVVDPSDWGDGDDSVPDGGSLGWILHRHLEKQADEAEALRLFYVATTRARDFLVLSSASDVAASPDSPAMRLLDNQFDRATGRFLGNLPANLHPPRVAVVGPRSPLPDPLREPTVRNPYRLLDVARVIRESLESADSEILESIRPILPTRLDLDPARGLSSRAARRDRLLRTILADTRSLDPTQWSRIAARAARLQEPVAPPALVAEVLDWLHSPIWRAEVDRIAEAPFVARGERFSIAVTDLVETVVVVGRVDFAYDNSDGGMTVLQATGPDTPDEPERLRLLLSAKVALAGRGEVPVRTRWVRFAELGPVVSTAQYDPSERANLVRDAILARAGG